MINRWLLAAAMIGTLTGSVLAGKKANNDKPAKPDKAAPKAPSLEELKAVIQPMLEALDLTAEQRDKANGVMSEDGWKAALEAFDKRRGGELRSLTRKKVPELMPTIMMPKMMAHNMQKMMKERMARQAGPPTPEEIEAIRKATRERVQAKVAPAMMGSVEQLAAKRMEEVRLDRKTLTRALAEAVSEEALTDKQAAKFDETLSEAGYPEGLVHGPDPVLVKRVNKLLESVADEVIAGLQETNGSGKKTEESEE